MYDSSTNEDPYEGQKFSSFDELKKHLEEYGKRNYVKFWIRSSHTINSLKTKIAKKMNPELKYVCMKFACIFGGEKIRCRGSGIRKSTTYRNLGCPCMINAVVGDDGNHVKLDTVVLEHNHALCKSLYDSLKKTKKKKSDSMQNNENIVQTSLLIRNQKVDKEVLVTSKQLTLKQEVVCHDNSGVVNGYSDMEDHNTIIENKQDNRYLKTIKKKYGNNVKILVINSASEESANYVNQEVVINTNSMESPSYGPHHMNLDCTEGKKSVGSREICRLCLSNNNKLLPIFNTDLPLQSTILSFKIMGCASIDVNCNDGLPSNICTECEATLDIAYNFRIQCEKSDSILRENFPESIPWNSTSKNYLEKGLDDVCNIKADCSFDIKSEVHTEEEEEEEEEEYNGNFSEYDYPGQYEGARTDMKMEVQCPICSCSMESYIGMLHHLKAHPEDSSLLLTCNMCNVICPSVIHLHDHMLEHVTDIDSQLLGELNNCSQCDLKFLTSDELREHEQTHVHMSESQIHNIEPLKSPPPVQDPKVANAQPFHDTKTLGQTGNFLCNVCGKILRTKDRFQSHKNMHEGLRPHVCLKCGKGFADRKNMHQHFDIVHLRKAKHECPICQKKFYTPTKMKSHITMHYGVKPFSCDVCHKTFRLKMNMIKHKKTHSNYRPHQCDKCNAAFIDKNMLKRHSYIHGGVRPFPCPICGHRFSVKFHLKKHLEKNKCHGNNEYTMDEWVSMSQTNSTLSGEECVVVYETNEEHILEGTDTEPISMDILEQYDVAQKTVVRCMPQI